MKFSVQKEVDVKTLIANMGPRYWDDASVNGEEEDENTPVIPCRMGDRWVLYIDLETGKIRDWPSGVNARVHYKVCDDGIYTLLDDHGDKVTSVDGYVPSMLCPDDNGYGDYVIMKINGDGFIENWKADLSYFKENDN